MAFGIAFSPRGLERIVRAMNDTKREFGALGADAGELIAGPVLDAETRREVQLRRFRKQAIRAARETEYYRGLGARAGVDLATMSFDDIQRLPLTSKDHLREQPDAFIARSATPVMRATTTGTTGRPTPVCFSQRELDAIVPLTAMSFANQAIVEPDDVVQFSISSRAWLSLTIAGGACARIGASAFVAGLVGVSQTLGLLTERRRMPRKRAQVSMLVTYPSYLGQLVEHGLGHGYRPSDFGLRRILIGGEIATAGLRERTHELFGPVEIIEGYSMTELVPFGGSLCSDGHLHYEPSGGLLEVCSLEHDGPAAPGEPGRIIATPLAPYRYTTLLVRYDTEDVVRPLADDLQCSMHALPATTHLLGKQRLSVRHEHGWTVVRDVIEALESVPAVPLPARYGFRPVRDGVGVEVVTRSQDAGTRRAIEDALLRSNVPLRRLDLRADRSELARPLPLRCDLQEMSFAIPYPPALRLAAANGR